MENPEEVLQALDEFQKMRPAEIPRELEDYLCWVAKTGDPVYQWSLIKALFREKLSRVMTDFYESCPSLELAPCPNVEHFNYDTMKSNLLERLESFPNAPFTVQRICELLTAPRKEYNRVDKFMRAIEKNILVVSTREPGATANGKRSDSIDSMVNGSVDDENQINNVQSAQEVEMDSWVKGCTSNIATSNVHITEHDQSIQQTVVSVTTILKTIPIPEGNCQEKLVDDSNRTEVSNLFTPTEFTGAENLSSQVTSQDHLAASNVQDLTALPVETPGIVGDVPEAIMNEDTSSQPSLDLDNEEGDSTESMPKLLCVKTTFQPKDFTNDVKSEKFYHDNDKLDEKDVNNARNLLSEEDSKNIIKNGTDVSVPSMESKLILDSQELGDSNMENISQANSEKLEDNCLKSDYENKSIQDEDKQVNESNSNLMLDTSIIDNSCTMRSVDNLKSDDSEFNLNENLVVTTEQFANTLVPDNILHKISESNSNLEDTTNSTSSNICIDKEIKNTGDSDKLITDVSKPIIEEPITSEMTEKKVLEGSSIEKDTLTIEEAMEDESKAVKSMIPDPIPIIEEPKDIDHSQQASSLIATSESESLTENNAHTTNENQVLVENHEILESKDNETGKDTTESVIENIVYKGKCESTECMEVDNEESLSIFHHDEPMEQETELTKS